MNQQEGNVLSMKAEPVERVSTHNRPKWIDKIPLVRKFRALPWGLMAQCYIGAIKIAYHDMIETMGAYGVRLRWSSPALRETSPGRGFCIYRFRRFYLMPLLGIVALSAYAQVDRFPMATYYEQGFIDREQPLPEEGLTYSRMMEHLQVGLPVKDRIRLDIRTYEGKRALVCQFRFGGNYEALRDQLCATDMYGPDSLASLPRSVVYQWFDPAQNIQVSLGYKGGISYNGVANYRYEVEAMDEVTRSRFYIGKDGRWERLPIIGATVLIHPIATFYDKYRTLREDVRMADSLAVYMTAPAVGESISLRLSIPRRDLPAKGQVYYAPKRSDAFPFGFLGKVAAVKRDGDKHVILFEEVRELDLFDVHDDRPLPSMR